MTTPGTVRQDMSALKGQSPHDNKGSSSTANGPLQSNIRSIEPPTLPAVNLGQTLTESLSDAFGRELAGVETGDKQDRMPKR